MPLNAEICGVNARIVVVLVKDGDTGISAARRHSSWCDRIGPGRSRGIESSCADEATGDISRKEGLLLNAVGGDSSNLSQHILLSVVDAATGTNQRFLVVVDVPGKANARLKHLGGVEDLTGRWETRVAEVLAVTRPAGRSA